MSKEYRAKIFKSGNSVALRLPKALGLVAGDEIVADPSSGEDPAAILALINPVLLNTEGSQTSEEGCLSFPEVQVLIERPERATFEGLSPDGRNVRIEAEGYLALILQHELDHLNGVLIIDFLGPVKRDLVKRKLRKRQRVEA